MSTKNMIKITNLQKYYRTEEVETVALNNLNIHVKEGEIDISWTIFIISGLTAIIIALLTISSQAFKAAIANPTKTLRDQ